MLIDFSFALLAKVGFHVRLTLCYPFHHKKKQKAQITIAWSVKNLADKTQILLEIFDIANNEWNLRNNIFAIFSLRYYEMTTYWFVSYHGKNLEDCLQFFIAIIIIHHKKTMPHVLNFILSSKDSWIHLFTIYFKIL